VQLAFGSAFAASWLCIPGYRQQEVVARMTHRPVALDVSLADSTCAVVEPFYNDAEVVSDEELASVLKKIVPRFSRSHLRPNLVEHALRTWGSKIEFKNPDAISGPQMADFLTDNAKYLESWGDNNPPLLEPINDGIHVRWGGDLSSSVHHDHTLAALTEAGLPMDAPVFTSARAMQVRNVVAEALRDFHLDERETEWSAMSFTLWMAPQKTTAWYNGEGRRITFDMVAERLMRNHKRDGVCLGTHRAYSLMLLIRLNEQYGGDLITAETTSQIMKYLETTRDMIIASQSADGSWPANWTDGADAEAKGDPKEKISKRVIATGHHLEWLSIAPQELHPPREQILKAADWMVKNVAETPQAEIDQSYTFYSHVGKALAMWRKTSPAEFWAAWREQHPECEEFEPVQKSAAPVKAEAH
jgi:hypothetical protein